MTTLDDDAPPREDTVPLGRRIALSFVAHHRLLLGVVLIFAFFALRLAYITADPPMRLPNYVRVYEFFTDPPAKSYEARNWALFGQWATAPTDNYQFWRLQAPVWVYTLAGFYRVFGVGYLQMRVFSTICAATGLAAMLVFAARKLRGWPYFLAGSFITFNFYYVIFSRSGLLETMLNTFVILTVLFLYLAQERLVWILAAMWTLVLAFLTKQTGLYLLPVALVAGTMAYVRALRRGAPLWLRVAPPAQALAIAAGMAWYVFRPAYWRTVAWNYGHMLFDKGGLDHVEIERFPLFTALGRLFSVDTWDQGFFSLFPVIGLLALIEVVRVLYMGIRRRRFDRWEVLVVAWAASSFGVLLLTPFLWVHYRLILFPPVALLTASLFHTLFRQPWMARRRGLVHLIAAGTLGLELLVHGTWLANVYLHRTYLMRDATRVIRKYVGNEGAVFAGMWAGPLVFDTKNKYYYIKDFFNSTPEGIAGLRLTHVLNVDKLDLTNGILWRMYPGAMKTREELVDFDLRGHTVKLFSFETPPGVDPPRH